MNFTKMQGCGNDYIYVDSEKEKIRNPSALARRISDRHYGVGADGLILICPSDRADFRMEMYNADGSRGTMCGNGIRCLGQYVYQNGKTEKKELEIETDSGIKKLWLYPDDKNFRVRVCMGVPDIREKHFAVSIRGRKTEVVLVSMGNPHAVIFLPPDAGSFRQWKMEYAREISEYSAFRGGINAELVRMTSEYGMKMRVWERGSGETLSCGTGACAAAAAAAVTGRGKRRMKIEMPGGILSTEWKTGSGLMYLEGTSRIICKGDYTDKY
ncbi:MULTISPECIES: diaminopimelate epimerase [Sellimonas]|uniref:Diaminopimelate epimerase n=1 Tax=Sellimonas caecigallum TaxID=2592333 RepID=A0ABS7L4L1_9FIRM|nr:diaminopimelate epimerase [Sellimonas caecigallum]MBY0757970.1 diaminopimelate epimerase [Sellimonas caecigallum]OUP01780.1 diaminopimelate epimerase [Drancourtella sp. An210]OUP65255.1 diaminopimelate epimerase [Drancourtella sp. An177]